MIEKTITALEIKAKTADASPLKTFLLALPGGGLIAFGFALYINTQLGGENMPSGVLKLLCAMTFSVGLMMVVMTGAELFTSTTMTLAARASGVISWVQLLKHWALSYTGNLVGAALVVALCYWGGLQERSSGAWGQLVTTAATTKVSYPWGQAFALGIGANFLVCTAVFMTFAGRSTVDKIIAVIGPITAFVALGFEHSIANMFLLPYGVIIGTEPTLTWGAVILSNLIPVTLGNIVGGGLCVGLFHWLTQQKLR